MEGRDLPTTADNSLDDERHMVEIARVGNMKLKVMDAVTESFQHWYQFMVDSIQDMDESSTEQKVKKLVHLVHLVLADLKTGCAEGQTLFKDTINVNYKQLAFAVYQKAVGSRLWKLFAGLHASFLADFRHRSRVDRIEQ